MTLVAVGGLGACGEQTSAVCQTAVAVLSGPEGDAMGKVVLTQGPNGVLISAGVSGLAPGPHGSHISYGAEPGAGDRVACGVIKRSQQHQTPTIPRPQYHGVLAAHVAGDVLDADL